jgi:hypothetical protein
MKKNFEQVFRATLDELQQDAKAAGMSLTSVCRAAGVARATPDRWRQSPPKTIRVLAKMQDTVAAHAAAKATADAAGEQQGDGENSGTAAE